MASPVHSPSSSSRPCREASVVAASTIAQLAQSEMVDLQPASTGDPPTAPPASKQLASPALCDVCAAPVAEAPPADEVACRAAAALLGADCAPSWLCRACAELLRTIDGHRRQLEAAHRLFWSRHRQGAVRKSVSPSDNAQGAARKSVSPGDDGQAPD